ncbi:MAG: hypothetical protein PUE30_02045, partial [Spirochaetia bacterium]|nr:hypothetical protein [Spirochaetia bacterium]
GGGAAPEAFGIKGLSDFGQSLDAEWSALTRNCGTPGFWLVSLLRTGQKAAQKKQKGKFYGKQNCSKQLRLV